jgi:type II secretory pathway component PulF
MSAMLERYPVFPREAVQMVRVGENTGNLGQMLLGSANFYEKEQELFIKRCTVMLEPALTLFVGLVVAIIALAVFLPMVNMISRLQ